MKVALLTSKATSLSNVGKDIGYVLHRHGHTPLLLSSLPPYWHVAELCDAVIIIYPASPLYCSHVFLWYRDFKLYEGKPIIFYTTIEGKPVMRRLKEWMYRDLEFIANSKYTYEKLIEAGLTVKGIIPHAIVRELVYEAEKLIPLARNNLKKLFPDKVIFGAIAFYHPRKGLENLAEAVAILGKKRKDFVVYLITSQKAKEALSPHECLHIDTVFGKRSREEILAWMGALDYLIVPSLAEGFCLPLLEANSMGTPVIHCAYPPLTEISDPRLNILFEYDRIESVDLEEGIEYEMHIYDPKALASAMEEAIELKRNDEKGYAKRRREVRKVIEKYDAFKHYTKLIRLIGA